MLGLVRRRLVQAVRPAAPALAMYHLSRVRPQVLPQAPQVLPRAPKLHPKAPQVLPRARQVGRLWFSSGEPRQVLSFPPSPPTPPLPEEESLRIKKLSEEIRFLENEFKFLFHLTMLLFGLIFTTLPMIPATVGGSEGGISILQDDSDQATKQAEDVTKDLSLLAVEMIKRDESMSKIQNPTPEA